MSSAVQVKYLALQQCTMSKNMQIHKFNCLRNVTAVKYYINIRTILVKFY